MRAPKVRRYLIELGNSTRGPLGAVVRLEATSKRDAIRKLGAVVGLGMAPIIVETVDGLNVAVYLNSDRVRLQHVSLDEVQP